MSSLNGPTNRDDRPLYNSRLIKNYSEYVNKFHPEVDFDSILKCAEMAKYEVEDPAYWFTQSQIERFYNILVEKTGNQNISREVGRYSASSKASGTVKQYAMGFMGPEAAYWVVEKFVSRLTKANTWRTEKLGRNKIEISVTPIPGVFEQPHQCENRMGYLEALSKLFTNKFAKIEHPNCLHKGSQVCRYVITWEKTPSLIWKLVRNYSLSVGILVSLILFFFLPTMTWVVLTLIFALLTALVSSYCGHLDRMELTKSIETQGDAAKDLLDEVNIRYNNALLIQEIGQATSTILDIDELIKTVVDLMAKHLDFERGMIMLANKENTRLVYTSGYGYSNEQENFLQGTEFHLDNPESKGVFVLSFKDQNPFLLNDIDENGKSFSMRSLELGKRMGVKSLICVPIVYEKESLGILAVDNINSKRVLTRTDMSLLIGVASQTAVNIVEAISFQKLQESEKKYRDLVENANSIILRRNVKGNITFFNEFAQKFFGYRENEILGKNVLGTILEDTESTKHKLDTLLQIFQQDPERQAVSEEENMLRGGESAWVAWTYKPIFGNDGQLTEILCIGNDISELKFAAKEKKTLEAQLQGAQKMEAIGTLAGGIAHDFNNILQAIIGYTQIILMGKESGDPDHEKLEAIESSAQRASELTKRLLIFGRKVESQLRPVDLNQEVVQVSKMLERTIPKMISIELRLAENLKVMSADPVQIEQIMMNMGVNARDAMPDGGELVFETNNVSLDNEYCKNHLGCSPGEYVLLNVSDTGHGMDKDLQEHIFEPFFTTKETGKGTGLGLAMVYGIVKSHNGYITCESEPGQGTSFKIYVPVIENGTATQEKEEAEGPLKGGSEAILLVDDEENIRQLGKEVLTSYGYTVMTAPDGESALEMYLKEYERIELVILDLSMPGMGGKKCLVGLIEINPQAKVIIASGYSVNGPTRGAIEAGAKAFVGKPYEVSQILKVVREVLDKPSP